MYTAANNMANFVPALYNRSQAVTMTTGSQADFYNAPNVANFSGLNTTTSSAYGTVSSAYPPRQIQLALKLAF